MCYSAIYWFANVSAGEKYWPQLPVNYATSRISAENAMAGSIAAQVRLGLTKDGFTVT